MSDDSDVTGGIIAASSSDPDAQATVSDYIDYTEYLPSDIVRSLTLIRGLDESYLNAAASVHGLTETYGSLPNLPANARSDPLSLRKQISEQLERALKARESAYAESCRIYDVVDRHFDRLGSIKSKLVALAATLSNDKAAPVEATTAEAKRVKGGRKSGETAPPPRITLRVDGARQPPAPTISGNKVTLKGRQRGPTTRAGLAPLNPDSPIASTEQSDEEAEPSEALPSSVVPSEDTRAKTKTPKKLKQGKARKVSQPADPSANETATAIELSTSNALALLKPPPEDARIGSEHLPWLRLSEWEMTTLRKKMKKNNIWQPSEIMIHRELAVRGRGWDNYKAAKANAESSGADFVDCDDVTRKYATDQLAQKNDTAADIAAREDTKLSNRGMKLNEAKKLKRENIAREQAALAAAEAEMGRLGGVGSTFKTLFPSSAERNPSDNAQHGPSGNSFNANDIASKDREKATKQTSKKRKFDETTTVSGATQTRDLLSTRNSDFKKRKLYRSAANIAEEAIAADPAALAAVPSAVSKISTPVSLHTEQRRSAARRTSVASKNQPTPPPLPVTRASSRPRSATGVSFDSLGRGRLQKKSATPAVRAQVPEQASGTAAGRRSKRPAPGPVTAGQDGGAAVSVGRRKAKPTPKKKRDQSQKEVKDDVRIDEDGVLEEIDPNEPRYCVCGDVSFGTMICCEDNDVSIRLKNISFGLYCSG